MILQTGPELEWGLAARLLVGSKIKDRLRRQSWRGLALSQSPSVHMRVFTRLILPHILSEPCYNRR